MTLAEKVLRAKQDLDDVFEAGKARGGGSDTFWESFALKKTSINAFYQWNENMFVPKGEIVLAGDCSRVFYGFNDYSSGINQPVSLVELLAKHGATLSTSGATSATFMFGSSNITEVPTLDFSKVSKLDGTFNNAPLEKIEKIILKADGTQTFTDNVFNCVSLRHIRFEGIIGNNIWFNKCTLLSAESYSSIINHLHATNSFTVTLPPYETVKTVHDAKYGDGSWDRMADVVYSNITFVYS